ncbi:MAG: hypothetical protein FJ302_06410 [Planctomycetes bacterium]|nr:hypothetical protein [Planctomycetota bacterium]
MGDHICNRRAILGESIATALSGYRVRRGSMLHEHIHNYLRQRFTDHCTPPTQIAADTDTLKLFPFAEGRNQTTRSADAI